MSDGQAPPYRSGLATGIGVVLLAGLVLAIVDVVHTGGAPLQVFGLWSLLTLPAALATGVVLAAGNATWGNGWLRGFFRRLRDDADLDRNVSAILLSSAVLAGVLVLVVGKLAVGLVGEVQRKSVGGLLLGCVVVALLPMLALGALPLHRVTRRIAALIPAIGPLPRVVLLVLVAVIGLVAAAAFVVLKMLDYQALDLGSLVMPALLPVVAVVLALVLYGPAASLRERIPMRGALAAVGVFIALAFPLLGLRGKQAESTVIAITEKSYLGPRLVPMLRKFVDSDKDGYSGFFGGPDCNDSDPTINPGADDTPDNGIDENCDGFDNKSAVAQPDLPTKVDEPETTLRGGDNVIVIFVDTLRFDRMGFTGYTRDGKSLTPRIDAFAAKSVNFKRAYAQASNTPRSVPSFLGSRYPTQTKVDDLGKNYPLVLDENEMLFEVLKPAGFTTIGMSSHFYFCDREKYPDTCDGVKNTTGKPMRTNAIQGADLWDNREATNISGSNADFAGPRIVAKTKAKLDELVASKQKFAMIVHLFEPHSTYIKHEGYPINTRGTESLIQKYDYEIAVEDKLIGELLDHLDTTGLAANTTVILMSDHGEAFGEHSFGGQRQFFHGMTLYNEVLHVPFIIRVPNAEPREVAEVVQLLDLAPTVAALFGIDAPESWQGRSLVPALEGKPLTPMPSFAEMPLSKAWPHEARSMISADGKYHVFHRISDSRWEVYDLANDPAEKTNLVGKDPKATELQQQLSGWAQAMKAGGSR